MVDVAKISLWGKEVGALSWDKRHNFGAFEFFPSFIESGLDISPIHLPIVNSKGKIFSFPNLNEDTFKGLPGMFSDVLPDDFGNRLINRMLSIKSISKDNFTPLDRLCYIGSRAMGALQFEPEIGSRAQQSTKIEISNLVEISQIILNERENMQLNIDKTNDLNELIKVGSSAGGQRAKAIIAYNPLSHEIRSGQTTMPDGYEHYIIKFDGVNNAQLSDPEGYGRIEYAYYLMALDCGINMMPSKLYEENGRAHFMTKRFDRTDNDEKIHMQTLCSLAHFDYKKPRVYSYEDAFMLMRQLKLPHKEAIDLFDRMVFNSVARNQDDHTKNISFLMDQSGVWRLSPAYDVTYSYNPTGIWTSSHQMLINGKSEQIEREDLLEVAKKINYKKGAESIDRIIGVISNWEMYANNAGISTKQSTKLGKAFRLDLEK